MAVREIILFPDPILRAACRPVERIDAEVRRLADDLAESMYVAEGAGLAAPQVGVPLRLAVVDVGVFGGPSRLFTLINPEIVEAGGEVVINEACLSFPGVSEDVVRARRILARYRDLEGKEVELTADVDSDGMLPIAVQHEVDHLSGIVFIDHLGRLRRELIKRKMVREKARRRAAAG